MPKIHKLWRKYLDYHQYYLTYRCNKNVRLYQDWTNGKDNIIRATMDNFEVTCKNCLGIINAESDLEIQKREKYGELYFLSNYEKNRMNNKGQL
jgi:hypothetical protein